MIIIYLLLCVMVPMTLHFLKVSRYLPVNNEWLKIMDKGKAIEFETFLSI